MTLIPKSDMKMISLDTETTGLDLRHGAKPFMVQVCRADGEQQWWEWPVDPETREPKPKIRDLREIQKAIDDASEIILQNPKFDVTALLTIMPKLRWDWKKVRCTLLAGHLLNSLQKHDLTTMVMAYLGVNVQPFEDKIEAAVKEVRQLCMGKHPTYPTWAIAKKGMRVMPSAGAKLWKQDMWLPRALARVRGLPKDHRYWTVAADYGNSDTETTLALYLVQREILKERKLWKIYEERLKILPIVFEMEAQGVTLSKKRLLELSKEFRRETIAAGKRCVSVAARYGCELELPKSGNNKSLLDAADTILKRNKEEPLPLTKKGNPSLDKDLLASLTMSDKPRVAKFFGSLAAKRQREAAWSKMEGNGQF